MLSEPSLGYKLFINSLLCVVGGLLASVAGVALIISISLHKGIEDIVGSAVTIVIGLIVAGFGVSNYRKVKKGLL